ncbi:L-threonate dehydrogenase [Roseivivax sp. CAU 1761]
MAGARVAVIGLGSMGYGMATALLAAGHHVLGVDLDAAAEARFRAAGGAEGALADAAPALDAVVVVVLNAAQTEAVLFGAEGIAPRLRPGTAILGCATVPPDFARRMGEACTERGLHYLDAPISGGAARAVEGRLSILAAGSEAAFAAARPVLDACAEHVFEIGRAPGLGSAMKAVNQLLAGVHIAVMGEALAFGLSQGLDPAQVMAVIPHCAGSSWMLENRGPHVRDGDYTPHSAVEIWTKDLAIVGDMARGAALPIPVAAAALQQFVAAVGMGLGREDDAAVTKVYARAAGLTLPGEG